jgi:dihydrodipicolinate synthase/N-acetylneuraminate lyase
MNRKFTVEHLRGVIAITPTPAIPGAEDFHVDNTVDIDESERMIRRLIEDGVDGIITNGTLGEMATLTLEEWKAFAAVVAETVHAANPDLPLFIGATTLNTRETVARIKYLHSLGVRGAFLGRPFWCELAPEAMMRFYQDITTAFPDMSLVLYDNPEAFKGPIPVSVYANLATNPGIIGVKYISLSPSKYRADMEAVQGKIRLLLLESDWLQAHILYPENAIASWSSSTLCGTEPTLFLRDALERGDYEASRWISARIAWAYEPFLANQNFREFSKYNIPLEKIRFNESGYVNAGPTRPPYHIVPPQYAEGARENGRRWRQIAEEVIRLNGNGK